MVRDTLAVMVVFALGTAVAAQDPEAEARVAEQEGRPDDALRDYLAALQALPDPPPLDADLRLRERILTLVVTTRSVLPVPPDAEQSLAKGQDLVRAQSALGTSGDTGGLEAAATEFRKAVRLAPWWPDAAFALAGVEQTLKHYESAAGNLRLYRLAKPEAPLAPAAEAPAAPARGDRATVYVYWPPQFGSKMAARVAARPHRLQCDGGRAAKLQEGRFVVLKLKPGVHTLDFRQKVSLDFQPGREYYVRASWGTWGNVLKLVTTEQATAEMQKSKVKPGDADYLEDAECGGAGATKGS